MKKIKLIAGAISLMLIAAVIASCGLNPFGKVHAKPGKYVGTIDSKKYEFFFTDSSAYKVIINGTDTFYGKGEEKDDGFRAATSETKIDVRYQAGALANLVDANGVLSYKRAKDSEYVKLEFEKALPEFTTTLKGSIYSYSGTGCINDYNNKGTPDNKGTKDDRPWGDLNTNINKNVKYLLNFYDTDKAYLEWEEDGVKRYFYAKEVVYKKNHRINMTFDELTGQWTPEAGKTPSNLKEGGVKDSKRYAVFDPQNDKTSTPILAFENAPLKKEL